MENVVDAMKLLGLDGRVHPEWVSAREGCKFKETVTELSSRSGRLTQVRFGMQWDRREKCSIAGGGVLLAAVWFLFLDSAYLMLCNQVTNLGDIHNRLSCGIVGVSSGARDIGLVRSRTDKTPLHPATPRIISRTRTPIPAATATTNTPIIE